MKLHIGCGRNLIEGFINIDNSPTVRLSVCPLPLLQLLRKTSLINEEQWRFSRTLKAKKEEFLRSDCLRLPFKDRTVDLCYSSHMLGWCLSYDQVHSFCRELHRVLRPGGSVRLSFFDFDQKIRAYEQHRSTRQFFQEMPLGIRKFDFRTKLKFLFSPNIQNGLPLNAETMTTILLQEQFSDIRVLAAGETTLDVGQRGHINLFEREGESIYIECRKPLVAH